MGLFSSSKSSSTTQNFTDQYSANFGDLSHDNLAVGGDYNPVGLTDDNLYQVLNFVTSTYDKALTQSDKTVSTVQSTAEKAIASSADAYSKASSDTATFFDSITPLLTIGAFALVGYALLKGK